MILRRDAETIHIVLFVPPASIIFACTMAGFLVIYARLIVQRVALADRARSYSVTPCDKDGFFQFTENLSMLATDADV